MNLKPLFIFSVCFIFSGCWLSSHPVPLPINEAEFSKPVQKPIKFSAPVKVKWNTDTIRQGHIFPFDITKLPSRYFNPTGFELIQKPITTKPFNYDSAPDSAFDLDAIPSEPLVIKTSLFGAFKKATLGSPKVRADSYFTSFQYSDEQGLPGAGVQAILHTRDGLCWIATSSGVCIQKGESLEIFPFNFGTIFFMAEDRLGQVWMRSREGNVFVIDRKSGIQRQIVFQFGYHLRIDNKGFIWVTSFNDGIYRINPDMKSFKHITKKNGLRHNNVIRTIEDRDGRIWIAYGQLNGFDILEPSGKKIKRIGAAQGLINRIGLSLMENSAGEMCIAGIHDGIDIVNIRKGYIKHLDSIQGIKKCQVFSLLEDDENRIWIGTDSAGAYILSKNSDSLAHIGSQEGLGDDFTLNMDKDNKHQVYIGTLSGGMNVFPLSDQVVHRYTKKDGLLDNDVWGFLADSKNRLWMGTYAGVNILMPDNRLLTLQVTSPENRADRTEAFLQTGPDQFIMGGLGSGLFIIDESRQVIEKITTKEGLPSNSILNLFKDAQGMIWIATADAGIFTFDPVKRNIRSLNQAGGLLSNRVDGIVIDSLGKIWIADFAGIELLDPKENTIRNYSLKEGLSNDQAVTIFKDSKNKIWVPTERGLNLLDPANETNTIFSTTNGMPVNGIYSILENGGQIYAGTGKGLTILSEKEKTYNGKREPGWNLETYGKPQGFQFMDFNGGNGAGIRHTGQFFWGIVQGITTMNPSVIASDTSTEQVYVTGLDILGKSQFFIDPALIHNADTVWSENKDTFYLKGTYAALNSDREKGIEWDSLSSVNFPVNLSLPPERNYLRFHFSNTLPQYEGNYKYMYILDGVDEKWSAVTYQPISDNYNNISPGYYTFRVSVKKGTGTWAEPSVYHFRIRPPWWQSWWAELAYFLLFVGVVRLWVSYRSRRLRKENAWLEQKVTERTTELSNSLENLRQTQGQLIQAEKMASLGELTAGIAHEIQNPLNFVNNFSEVNTELLEDVNRAIDQGDIPEVKDILKDVEMNMGKITFHGKRADAIVKGMLLHSRASSGQKIPTDVNALADEYLRLSYHGLRAKDKSFNAQFTMDLDQELQPAMLVQQDIGRVLLNLFNNAFYSVTEKKKQFPEGYQPTVSVATKKKNGTIEIRIRDNGQGIPQKVIDKIYQPFFTTKPAGQGTGLGLSLSYDIITKEHNGKIDVTTKENEFTEFIISLPVQPVV